MEERSVLKRDESTFFRRQQRRVHKVIRSAEPSSPPGIDPGAPRNPFKASLEGLPRLALSGHWLQVILTDPDERVSSLVDHTRCGARFSPPRTFLVLYTMEDDADSRAELTRWMKEEDTSRVTVMCIHVNLERVLDLCDPEIQGVLGTTLIELTDPDDMSVCQAIGVAAYRADYQGILYPRSRKNSCRNLAMIPDHVAETFLGIADRF